MLFPDHGYMQHFTFLAANGEEGVAVAQTKPAGHRSERQTPPEPPQ